MSDLDRRLAAARRRVDEQRQRVRTSLQRSKAAGARASAAVDAARERVPGLARRGRDLPVVPSYAPDAARDVGGDPSADVRVEVFADTRELSAAVAALESAGWHVSAVTREPDGRVRAVFVR